MVANIKLHEDLLRKIANLARNNLLELKVCDPRVDDEHYEIPVRDFINIPYDQKGKELYKRNVLDHGYMSGYNSAEVLDDTKIPAVVQEQIDLSLDENAGRRCESALKKLDSLKTILSDSAPLFKSAESIGQLRRSADLLGAEVKEVVLKQVDALEKERAEAMYETQIDVPSILKLAADYSDKIAASIILIKSFVDQDIFKLACVEKTNVYPDRDGNGPSERRKDTKPSKAVQDDYSKLLGKVASKFSEHAAELREVSLEVQLSMQTAAPEAAKIVPAAAVENAVELG